MKRALALVFFALGCNRAAAIPPHEPATMTNVAPPPPPMTDDQADASEATFRYMFEHNGSGMQDRARVHCLAFEGDSDPPPAFLARFARDAIPARPVSACSANGQGVYDDKTDAKGLLFRLGRVFIEGDTADIAGGYYEAGLSASGNEYTLERRRGVWVVTKDEMQWVA